MFQTTLKINDQDVTLREPRIIDNALITSVLKKLDRDAIVTALGFTVSEDTRNQVTTMLLDEMYIYACMAVLLVRDKSDTAINKLFPDLFTDTDTLTQGFIDLYINGNYTEIHRTVSVSLNELFNRQQSPELADKAVIDPK